MLQAEQLETLIQAVGRMDRATIARNLSEVRTSFPIDFTPQFIESTEINRLRHIYLAVCLQSQQMPATYSAAA